MDHVIFPRFWSEKPTLWFAQVEAVFALNEITSDTDKYDYIITELNNDIISLLEDVILNPPGEDVVDKYAYLKRELIERLSIAQMEKEELGNKKPSDFLKHLRNIADPRVSEETVRRIWLSRLPKYVNEIVTVESSGNIEVLSEMADKIIQVIAIPTTQDESPDNVSVPQDNIAKCLSKLSVQLDCLQGQLENLQVAFTGHHVSLCNNCKSKSDTTVNNNSDPNTSMRSNVICWYHVNFGERATKCVSPCAYKEKNISQDLLNVTSY